MERKRKKGCRAPSERKVEGLRLLSMTPMERVAEGLPVSLKEIADKCKVHPITIYQWLKEIRAVKVYNQVSEVKLKGKTGHPMGTKNKRPGPAVNVAGYDSEEYLNNRSQKVDEALLASCEGGNANSLRTYYQLTKRLVEKTEVTHKISGSDLARLALQAARELREVDSGVVKVRKGLRLLPEDLRLSSGQKSDEVSPVPDVATSGQVNQST